MHMMTFGADEKPRSMQLYGVDPKTMAEAVRIIVGEGLSATEGVTKSMAVRAGNIAPQFPTIGRSPPVYARASVSR